MPLIDLDAAIAALHKEWNADGTKGERRVVASVVNTLRALPTVQPEPAPALGAEWMRREVHGRVAKVLVASCRCGSKSFEADWHLDNCPYKVLSQVDGMVECIPGPTPAQLLADALALAEAQKALQQRDELLRITNQYK